ncbi:Lacal_2735 family protein [Muricauda sp. JGD-17]|uniref:Lacal_2735 family protein n=1 Tax=Flagellimonas ochracea TaxID=2696472 RepID=A0A964T9K0_9FLAO|nr:Lacal_2735 family protein [Allomuricauda ochracea]NAY90765.1 Lacal_2735 family protein [Allomuricauda ochracea]
MFGLFKKKSEKEKLQEQYAKLLSEAHALSTSNRKLSDQKAFEAEEVMKKIDLLD